jgi:hypothetical protein
MLLSLRDESSDLGPAFVEGALNLHDFGVFGGATKPVSDFGQFGDDLAVDPTWKR